MAVPRVKSTAVLIGYNADGRCVYSEIIDIHDYYDAEHIWDQPARIKRLKLEKVRGFLFRSDGELDQEFESNIDIRTGTYAGGSVRCADGTELRDP